MDTPNRFVIVVGVDFSPTGDLAIQRAFDLASRTPNTEVHLVNVVRSYGTEVQLEFPGYPGFTAMPLGQAGEQLRRYTEERLKKLMPTSGSYTPKRVVTHVRLDAPAEEIAQLASDLEADLVVVGTHGRRGLSRMLMGSVAEGVVRLAPCAVLVERPKNVEPVPKIAPPCPECVKTRQATQGREFWCEQHRERHGQRHTYHSGDRVSSDSEMPLFFHQ